MEPRYFDRHQLAGLDDRQRGFNRPVELERAGDGYRATLRYESVRVITDPHPTPDAALAILIRTLHDRGYRQLRTQMSFRNGLYLGAQEPWVERADPPEAAMETVGLIAKFLNWFRSRATDE